MVRKSKVKNETQVEKSSIEFKSKLECYTYEAFIKAGIPVKYEPKHFVLLPGFEFDKLRVWDGIIKINKKGKKTHSGTEGNFKSSSTVNPITYCPYFIGDGFIIECKGLVTDSFPLRFKLFKRYLKQHHSNTKVYLVRNHAQVDEMVKEIINDKQSTLCQNS